MGQPPPGFFDASYAGPFDAVVTAKTALPAPPNDFLPAAQMFYTLWVNLPDSSGFSWPGVQPDNPRPEPPYVTRGAPINARALVYVIGGVKVVHLQEWPAAKVCA